MKNTHGISNLLTFIQHVQDNGGGSYNMNTGDMNPKDGYFASMQGHETIVNHLNEKTLFDFIKANVMSLTEEDKFIGAWDNDGRIHLDVSVKFDSKEEAIQFGRDNAQIAIYDANEGKDIILADYFKARLEELRTELRAERISTGELLELQSLAKYIEEGDVELLEAAGVPEN